MYLKSIELYGFKSFSNKMNFTFDDGITAIVGPNGSGKSNISDALRFVLGEQSVKQMRGGKLSDIIFSGTQTRRPAGYCQVEITIGNPDGNLASEYKEITVSRRIYRNGESEFLINKSPCRLKDIQELFLDTGIGKDGYSIISQGQISEILSVKAEDRRQIFDEAAGIVKYRTRRDRAVKRLEKNMADLERTNDIIMELESQASRLKGQAKRATKYLKIRDELRKYEVNSFIRLIDGFESNIKELKDQEKIVKDDLESKKQENQKLNKISQELDISFKTLNDDLEAMREAINNNKLKEEKTNGEITLISERISNLKNNNLSLENQCNENKEVELDLFGKKHNSEKELKDLRERENKLDQELQMKQGEYDNLSQEYNRLREEHSAFELEKLDLVREEEGLKNKLAINKIKLEEEKNKLSNVREKTDELEKEISEIDLKKKQIKNTSHDLLKSRQALIEKKDLIINSLDKLCKKIGKLEEDSSNINRTYSNYRSRLESLELMEANYEGYYNSVRMVLQLGHKGIIGTVSDLIKVDKKYTTAIETALGNSLQNIVTETDKEARFAINYLKEKKYGRATFLPINKVIGKKNSGKYLSRGYIGIGSDLVDYNPRYKGIIDSLLGNILLVDEMVNGLELAKSAKFNRIITLDGDVISSNGAMTGGNYKAQKQALISRKNTIKEYKLRVSELKELREKNKQELIDIKGKKEEIQTKIESIKKEIDKTSLDLNREEIYLEELEKAKEKSSQKLSDLKKQALDLEDSLKILTERQASYQVILDNFSPNRTELNEDLNKKIRLVKDDLDRLSASIVEKKIALNTLTERIINIKNQVEELDKIIKDSIYKREKISEEIRLNKIETLKMSNQKEKLQEELLEVKAQIVGLEEDYRTKRLTYNEIQVSRAGLENKLNDLDLQINLLEKNEIKIVSSIEKAEYQRDASINYMWEEYELTYSGALLYKDEGVGSDTNISKQIRELKKQIKGMGNINVGAIAEYKEVSSRYNFLKEQRDDVSKTLVKLEEIIEKLNKKMTKQFLREFKEINESFGQVFKELFEGGEAYLELSDTGNLLESGILIHAQPPGKKLQNMMLLSGGEKSLTAIALIFSLQRLRPSPFCMLDEIDAALDDANVYKFARYLKKLSKKTQMIVITHRKGTMEVADCLYGITMQEKGISTQVSVSLVEADIK